LFENSCFLLGYDGLKLQLLLKLIKLQYLIEVL